MKRWLVQRNSTPWAAMILSFFWLFQGSGQLPKPCIPGGGDVLSHIVLRAVTSCEVIQQTYQTWSSDVGDHQRVIGVAGT